MTMSTPLLINYHLRLKFSELITRQLKRTEKDLYPIEKALAFADNWDQNHAWPKNYTSEY
jgi:hypothetical protein